MKTFLRWERLDKHTHRTKVPFGWVVRFDSQNVRRSDLATTTAVNVGVAMVFVFDPFRWWKVEKPDEA